MCQPSSCLSILLGPFLSRGYGSLLVFLPALCDVGCEGVVRVGCAKKCLDREEDGADLESGGPVVLRKVSNRWGSTSGSRQHTLEDIEADAAELVHVGVENLCQETDLGRRHGVVVGKEQFELENASCTGVRDWSVARDPSMTIEAYLRMATGRGRGSRHRNIAGFPREGLH
jgi:hypothetical protein